MSERELRWAESPQDGHVHAMTLEDAQQASQRDSVKALCGHIMPGEGLALASGPFGNLCVNGTAGCADKAAAEIDMPDEFGWQ